MNQYRLVLLTAFLFLSGSLQSVAVTDSVSGPYNGSFIPAGLGLKKPLNADDSARQANHSWTFYCWVKSDIPIAARTLLAGFGEPEGAPGTQRYFSVRGGKLSFLSGDAEVSTETFVAPGKWQFLTAT